MKVIAFLVLFTLHVQGRLYGTSLQNNQTITKVVKPLPCEKSENSKQDGEKAALDNVNVVGDARLRDAGHPAWHHGRGQPKFSLMRDALGEVIEGGLSPDQRLLKEVCEDPKPTPLFKWQALADMAKALNSLGAPYNLHAGNILGLVRGCYIFDSDIDFAIEREWLEQNLHETVSAIKDKGFNEGVSFGDPDEQGYEATFNTWLFRQNTSNATQQTSQLEAMLKAQLDANASSVRVRHRNGIKVDLFTMSRKRDHYEWGIWLTNPHTGKQKHAPCTVKSTHTGKFNWAALIPVEVGGSRRMISMDVDVMLPFPLKDALVSLYGADYMTPRKWRWNVEPFTVGSCRMPSGGFP